MSLINALDTAATTVTSTAKSITEQSETITENGLGQSTFGSLLSSLSSSADTVDSTLTGLSNIEVLSVESLQDQLLQQTGLGNESLLSLAVSDGLMSQMQQELLASLQTSMIKSSAVATAVSGSNPLQSTVGITHAVNAETSTESSAVDEVYSFSFGEEGLDENDLFDSVNVLNHIPILSEIYQLSTNTDISPVSKLLGSMLYSGPIGVGVAALELGMNYFTGYTTKDLVADAGSFLSATDENSDTQ
ncbi:hypothetical protein [Shewanella ulleungensis]|uniref:Uncharacterized protein n=1 Tax=Shewanella ulleungensis TaxID=2282699 RepID=A0ABQ2QYF6_9GAMM|nr:hypothetical protein [Shewanella ulleungensis]MCL1152161.1 hypothetical protein [Shewanella ulleungensis]GGQ00557.1 hypothetical protein GCM10009410_37860 [Shewanella ulleungensis]